MAYDITTLANEAAYRALYLSTYCAGPIITFDNIAVRFYADKFDHAFFESVNRQLRDKSAFSMHRAERILWIRDTLQDPTADCRVGWDKKNKCYDNSRRVAIVQGNYVVIIWVKSATEAKFVTAYTADNSINKILASPAWT